MPTFATESTSFEGTISIPKKPEKPQPAENKIIDGKVLIKRVELKGTSLFPEYGVSQAYLSSKLNSAYGKLDAWMTVSDMHFLADALTLAYHEKGLTFNQVFVVPDEIENNTLVLNILSGIVSEINIKNNKLYTEDQVKKPFRHLLGKVVYEPDIQRAMQAANSTPGLKVFGFFSMGSHPGQTRLNLHILKEDKHSYAVRTDNYGINNTGVYRIIGQYQRHNVTGRGDTLQGNIISTNEVGNLYGGISYQLPITDKSRVGGAIYSSLFEVVDDFEVFGLTGHLTALSGFWNSELLKQKNALALHSHTLSIKHSEIRSDSGSSEIDNILSENTDYIVYQPQFSASVLWPSGKQLQSLDLGAKFGHITKTNNDEIDNSIFVLELNYTHEIRWKGGHPSHFVSTLKSKNHYTNNVLPSSEKKVMTGPYAIRAYKPALFSADTVYSLTLEQNFIGFPITDEFDWVPFVFIDAAYGEQNGDEMEDETLGGHGIGMKFHFKSTIDGAFTIGFPVDLYIDEDDADDGPIIYGYINAKF